MTDYEIMVDDLMAARRIASAINKACRENSEDGEMADKESLADQIERMLTQCYGLDHPKVVPVIAEVRALEAEIAELKEWRELSNDSVAIDGQTFVVPGAVLKLTQLISVDRDELRTQLAEAENKNMALLVEMVGVTEQLADVNKKLRTKIIEAGQDEGRILELSEQLTAANNRLLELGRLVNK